MAKCPRQQLTAASKARITWSTRPILGTIWYPMVLWEATAAAAVVVTSSPRFHWVPCQEVMDKSTATTQSLCYALVGNNDTSTRLIWYYMGSLLPFTSSSSSGVMWCIVRFHLGNRLFTKSVWSLSWILYIYIVIHNYYSFKIVLASDISEKQQQPQLLI